MALRQRSPDERPAPADATHVVHAPAGLAVCLLRSHGHASPDALIGGTPHLHGVVTEGYLCVAGRGRLLVIDHSGPAEHALLPGTFVWCAPGTLARLVDDGDLVVALLVERAHLDDAFVPSAGTVSDGDPLAVHAAAVAAMLELSSSLQRQDIQGYVALHRSVAERFGDARQRLALLETREPTRAGADLARHRLQRLAADDAHHLLDAVASAALAVPPCAHLVGTPVTAG